MSDQLNDVILKELDKEWVELMKLAKKTGISLDEVRRFLRSN
ncbi:anti-repressor SinI family protein [Bacillus sp. AGMB 02131]|uniref:Anti-repressor SinI family protein n=1 Tax=Peribacillus faecalis TaxID=2772559 RepID=A0A927HB65_9BACI|nr:anti-repressor SinI family protein [Peribacillus faecalis]MBD3108669.1 anti-repressor SinI family protein [Peribacillus faecalis]